MDKSVTVVFSVDKNYYSYLCVAIQSMMENASIDNRYEIIVLHIDLSHRLCEGLRQQMSGFGNFSIRFLDASDAVSKYGLKSLYVRKRFSPSTYYRLLIAELLPDVDKVVYLDCDIAVLCDVADLYRTPMEGMLLAAVEDVGVRTEWLKKQEFVRYLKNHGLVDSAGYFNAGILVMNLMEIRTRNLKDVFFEVARRDVRYFLDQDVLNITCKESVVLVDNAWNVQLSNPVDEDAQLKIIHFCGIKKPWTSFSAEFSDVWWQYARKTANYELMLFETVRRQMLPLTRIIGINALRRRVFWIKLFYRFSFGGSRVLLKRKYKELKQSYDLLLELGR